MLDRSLKLKDKMGCPYCYLAARLRSPCPCTYYQTAGLLNLPLSPIFPVSRNIEDDNMTTGRDSGNTRDRGWELGMRGTQSLNEFDNFFQLPIPYYYLRYPISPIVYFGGKVLPQVATAQAFKVPSIEHMSPARAQLRPEMVSSLNVENKNSQIEVQREDECHDSAKTAEKIRSATKTQSHENAWGGPTYTELITEAILSSPENRMTLSQIYNWITENVEYFRERKNNTSARGWKVSFKVKCKFLVSPISYLRNFALIITNNC